MSTPKGKTAIWHRHHHMNPISPSAVMASPLFDDDMHSLWFKWDMLLGMTSKYFVVFLVTYYRARLKGRG